MLICRYVQGGEKLELFDAYIPSWSWARRLPAFLFQLLYLYRLLLARSEKGAPQGWECKEGESHTEKYMKEADSGSNPSPTPYNLGNPGKLLKWNFFAVNLHDSISLWWKLNDTAQPALNIQWLSYTISIISIITHWRKYGKVKDKSLNQPYSLNLTATIEVILEELLLLFFFYGSANLGIESAFFIERKKIVWIQVWEICIKLTIFPR